MVAAGLPDAGTLRGHCLHCGEHVPVTLHSAKITPSKAIGIMPILPACLACGADVQVHLTPEPAPERRLIVLTGTCASGKSTMAEALVTRHGFAGIDGNGVQDVVAYKHGTSKLPYNGPEMLAEIAWEIDLLLALRQDIVLSHVIVPDDLPTYRTIFRRRQLRYSLFVLQPAIVTAVARSQARTCFASTTDAVWVTHFHDAMCGYTPQPDVHIVDNSTRSAEEGAEMLVRETFPHSSTRYT